MNSSNVQSKNFRIYYSNNALYGRNHKTTQMSNFSIILFTCKLVLEHLIALIYKMDNNLESSLGKSSMTLKESRIVQDYIT